MEPLSAYVRKRGLTTSELLDFARALVERVAQDHALDVWRGDLSPQSVRWDGSARVELAPEPAPRSLPEDHEYLRGAEALLAVGYLAPEQCEPERGEPGPRSDVFAIGVLIYELATGEHPFADATGDEIAANVVAYHPRTPGQIRNDLPLEWDAITACCMHKEIEQRFSSALDIVTAVEALARSGGTRRKDVRLAWGRIALALLVPAGLVLLLVWLL